MTDEKRSPVGFVVTLLIATLSMLGPFSIDTIFPAFDLISGELGASTPAMQQVTSSYLFAFAIMSLFHGPVSDAVGRKPVMVIGLLGYAAASVLCALAPSLTVLIIGRVLQGAFAGAGQIISRTVIRDLYEGADAQAMMSQVAMIFAVAPAVAPVVGGWVLGVGSWRVIFWSLVVTGLGLAAWVAFGLPETHPTTERVPLNLRTIVTGLRQVLTDGPFLRLALAGAFGFGAQFLYIASAPIIMLHLLGKGEHDFWMLFVPMVSGMISGAWVGTRLAHRIPPRRLATAGFLVQTVAAVVNVVLCLVPATSGLPWVMIGPPLLAFGTQLFFPVLQLQMLDRFPHRRGAAASGQSFLSLVFNAILTAVVSAAVTGSLAHVAIASACFTAVGVGLWFWHRSATAADPV